VTLGDDGHLASVRVSCLGLGLGGQVSGGGYVSGLGLSLVGPGLVKIPAKNVTQLKVE